MISQLSVLQKQNEVLSEELSVMKTHLRKKLKYMADTLNRIAVIPAHITHVHLAVVHEKKRHSKNLQFIIFLQS